MPVDTAVVVAIALASLLLCAAQVSVESPARLLVAPHVPVDRLVADRQIRLQRQSSCDLLWAPTLCKEGIDPLEVACGEVLIPARARSAPIGHLLGLAGAIASVGRGAIPHQLAPDRAPVASQLTGDCRISRTLHSKGSEHIPLLRGDLAIRLTKVLYLVVEKLRQYRPIASLHSEALLRLVCEFAMPNNTLQRTGGHGGRTVHACMCARAGAEWASCLPADLGR